MNVYINGFWSQCTACDVQQNGQTPKTMLDQKQNWLVSGAYPSHIFRLERHRNHHVETHAQTHINTKSPHCHTQKRKSKHNRRTTFHNHLSTWMSKSMHSMWWMGDKHGQQPWAMLDQKQNWLVSGAYLSHIFRLERHRIITSRLIYKHTYTHQHTNTFRTEDEMTEVQSLMIYEQLQMYINFNPFRVQEYLNFIYIYIHIYVFTIYFHFYFFGGEFTTSHAWQAW